MVTPSPKNTIKYKITKKITKCKIKKKYRGRGSKYKKDCEFTIMLSNLRGFK